MATAIKSTKKTTTSSKGNVFATLSDRPRFTGKKIITMHKDAPMASMKSLTKKASLKMASIRDFASGTSDYQQAFSQGDGIYFDTLKIAIVNGGNDDQVNFMTEKGIDNNNAIQVEPERFVYALPLAKKTKTIKHPVLQSFTDNDIATWGVQAIKVLASAFTGKGINIAVLDTGLNLKHPDFSRLTIQSQSFIKSQAVEDKNGHGTHCCGIAVGAIDKKTNQRYGVASGANLFVGKVLSNSGSGDDSGILAGIEWALLNKCRVISMSLGSAVGAGETFSPAYENAAKIALDKDCIIIAAAGNESQRSFGLVSPVGHPANCPSIFSVAAIDSNMRIADFSCGGINPNGGQVDIAAPGVDIFSSWKGKKHNTISGTSMATPFVAGLAALLCEANPGESAAHIWMKLTQHALRLDLESADVGAGLAQAQ
ncbi:MAG: S8 family serine peptidase [Ferruginibacter sp.]